MAKQRNHSNTEHTGTTAPESLKKLRAIGLAVMIVNIGALICVSLSNHGIAAALTALGSFIILAIIQAVLINFGRRRSSQDREIIFDLNPLDDYEYVVQVLRHKPEDRRLLSGLVITRYLMNGNFLAFLLVFALGGWYPRMFDI